MENNLPICEMFTSIQGEGSRSGFPSIFIRVSGCNLRCVFGNTICDTAYSSFNPEKPSITFDEAVEYCTLNYNIQDIVITGGEPMLYKNQVAQFINQVVEQRGENCKTVFTIETNGTLPTVDRFKDLKHMDTGLIISCSPKLRTAFNVEPDGCVRISGTNDVLHFSSKRIDYYNSLRINIDNLVNIAKSNASYIQFKFVYTDENSVEEIKQIVEQIEDRLAQTAVGPKKCDVYLMPEGIDTKTLEITRKKCAEACIENNWKYTDRLHIIIWGNKRGV